MTLDQFITALRERPSMYLCLVEFNTVTAALQGFDLANDGEALTGLSLIHI